MSSEKDLFEKLINSNQKPNFLADQLSWTASRFEEFINQPNSIEKQKIKDYVIQTIMSSYNNGYISKMNKEVLLEVVSSWKVL